MNELDLDKVIFEAVIPFNEVITLQNDSVLSWKPADGRDMALSFEFASCLSDVW